MPKLKVDGVEIEVPAGATVLQACELAGKEIPRFCYHERLSIAGNCRMCLVEVKPGPPKPQASCALPAADKQEIFTNSPMVKNAREGVMEFLLINHPLDCPICDQGGECDLQDQSVAYGRGQSRYSENKRAVTEKYMGPIVKTVMTRCIQCTRCIRFAEEVAGVEEIGAIGRGENMQIVSYLEHAVTSELSGNVVDLCPVGALTSKPYAFEARPWELKKTLTIDVMDAVGTNIRLDSRGRQVLRALPRINEDVNEEWASDKTRHAVDGLVRRRLDKPYIRKDGRLTEASWDAAFLAISQVDAGASVAAVAGDLVDCETMYATKALLGSMGSTLLEGRQTGMDYDTSSLAAVNFNTTIAGTEKADVILIVGSNVRWEAPLVNTRIRKAIKKGAKVFAIGPETELTYKVEWLGADLGVLGNLPEAVTEAFAKAERPMVIVGGAGLKALGAALALVPSLGLVKDGWNGFNVLHMAASRMGGLMLGYAQKGGIATWLRPSRSSLSSWARTKSISARLRIRSKSISAIMATRGQRQRTWFCRRRAMPRNPAPMSISRPGAARRARRLPAGRCPRGLDDPARSVGRDGQDAAVRYDRGTARGDGGRYACARNAGAGDVRLGTACARRGRCGRDRRLSDQGFLSDERDLSRVADDAALLG